MQYVKIKIDVAGKLDYEVDALTYYLSEAGCDSFETITDGAHALLCAYVCKTLYSPESLKQIVGSLDFSVEDMVDKDWNEEWEKNSFKSVIVDSRCCICSTSHSDVPSTEYKILINPKMAFGSGSHQTTAMMLTWILDEDMSGRSVLDMGCGTAVLGILAAKRGAAHITGIDIDEWSVRNASENIELNDVTMSVELGDASSLAGRNFDIILANINLNILKADLPAYVAALTPGGVVFMSGYYVSDLSALCERAAECGLKMDGYKERDGWCAAKFISTHIL